MVYIYGANAGTPRIDAPQPLEQPAPLRTIGPIRAVTTPLGDVVGSPFSVGADTGCANAALRVTGGGHFTQSVGIGVCPPGVTGDLTVAGTSDTTALGYDSIRIGVVAGIPTIKLEDSGSFRWLIENNAGVLRFLFPGAAPIPLQISTSAVIIGTDPSGAQTLRVGGSGKFAAPCIITDNVAASDPVMLAYLSFQRSSVEKGWIGFGDGSGSIFRIKNNIGLLNLSNDTQTITFVGAAFSPISAGVITLGTASLPWGPLTFKNAAGAVITTGTGELSGGGGSSPTSVRLAFGTDNTGWQLRFAKNVSGTVTDLWALTDNSGEFFPLADNSYNIGDTTHRLANLYTKQIQLFDDVTSGNPYIQWTWKNASGTARGGYLEATGDGVRFYSGTFGADLFNFNYSTGRTSIGDGSTNRAQVAGVVVSTSAASGDYPEGTIWCKV